MKHATTKARSSGHGTLKRNKFRAPKNHRGLRLCFAAFLALRALLAGGAEFDVPSDDIEKDPRPSGDSIRTDRGADQYHQATAGDLKVTLPRIPPLDGPKLGGGGFEIIAVGPQPDLPVID